MEKTKAGIISIIIVVIIVIGSVGAFYAITRGLRTGCIKGESFDNNRNKCIHICINGKVYNDKEKECKCPEGLLSVGGKCKTLCERLGKKTCGEQCYNPDLQSCDNNNNICDNNRIDFNKNMTDLNGDFEK